jgi:hypothetical protein
MDAPSPRGPVNTSLPSSKTKQAPEEAAIRGNQSRSPVPSKIAGAGST